jgi:hypothetical protein
MFTVLGSRYIVSTVALEMSVLNRSCTVKRARSAMPSAFAASFASRTSFGSMSTPKPLAPNTLAAVSTMRPSPDPRSMTKSFGPTSARLSMSETTLVGDGT